MYLELNSSLDKLVKSLTDDDFKYLYEKFGSKNLELVKQKGAYPYEYMNSSKRFTEKKLPGRECFYRSVKDEATGDNDENLDGHISYEDYLMCQKIWDVFGMKSMRDITIIVWKNELILLIKSLIKIMWLFMK